MGCSIGHSHRQASERTLCLGLVRCIFPRQHMHCFGSGDKTIRLWDAASGTAIGQPLQGHSDWVSSVSFSPDGTRIVSSSGDKTVRLWDAASGTATGEPLQGHSDKVLSIAFSPDGTCIVSGSATRLFNYGMQHRAQPSARLCKDTLSGSHLLHFPPTAHTLIGLA